MDQGWKMGSYKGGRCEDLWRHSGNIQVRGESRLHSRGHHGGGGKWSDSTNTGKAELIGQVRLMDCMGGERKRSKDDAGFGACATVNGIHLSVRFSSGVTGLVVGKGWK